jgi:hypothetical protein
MATLPLQYPLTPLPSVSGNLVTVDTMLDQPTRITRYLSDLSLQNLFANRIFATPGGVTGGGLVYDQLTTTTSTPAATCRTSSPVPSSRSSTRPARRRSSRRSRSSVGSSSSPMRRG